MGGLGGSRELDHGFPGPRQALQTLQHPSTAMWLQTGQASSLLQCH